MDTVDQVQLQNDLADQAAIARAAAQMSGPRRADCEDCGNEIPAPRRAANPAATRCVYCQSAYEKRMKRT